MSLDPSDSPYSGYLNHQGQQYSYAPTTNQQYIPNEYKQPLNQTIPPDVMPYNYSTTQPKEQEENDSGAICCLAFLSLMIPLLGWILGCTLSNKKHAKICGLVGLVSFAINLILFLILGLTRSY